MIVRRVERNSLAFYDGGVVLCGCRGKKYRYVCVINLC